MQVDNSTPQFFPRQASLVGHIDESGLLQDGAAFIEFGAGKGDF